jgi:HAD superfamily hydrolase (TIGR01509 family)
MTDRFVADVEHAVALSRGVLAILLEQGYRLGVVSNACGNARVLCEEYGFAPMLSAIVDSHEFGAAKPDLAIFRRALSLVAAPAVHAAFVGDSLDRDIGPAKRLGMRTVWIADGRPDAVGAADAVLESVLELPSLLAVPARTA